MSWLEQRIRQYEHRRWTTDNNRRVRPFAWGLEHIGGNAADPEPRKFLSDWVPETLAHSEEWFETSPALDYALDVLQNGAHRDRVLTFTSAITSLWPENNRVHARLFGASNSGPAVVVLPQWNAKWDVQVKICQWLNRWGITALRLSMPYHDRRMIPGHERADHLVGPNMATRSKPTGKPFSTCAVACNGLLAKATENWDWWVPVSVRRSDSSPWRTSHLFGPVSSCMSLHTLRT